MPNINQVTLAGHLGRDAEVRVTQAGKPWATFSVAVTEKYKAQDGSWKETTTWVNCKWWGCYDNAGDWLKKGRGVFVTGKLAENSYEKQDGTKVKTLEVKVDHCYPVENTKPDGVRDSDARYAGRQAARQSSYNRPAATPAPQPETNSLPWDGASDDDVPF